MSDSSAVESASAELRPRHEIRSYVLRQGRLTAAQREALASDWSRFGLDWPRPQAHPAQWFASPGPVVLEIGFGNGEAIAAAAQADPDRRYLGIEVHRPGVGRLLQTLRDHDLDTVRVICADAVAVLREGIAPASLDEVRLYFPDPWPKTRHHKRRIVQTPFVELLASRTRPGGLLHMATDWEPYAQWMLAVLAESALWQVAPAPPSDLRIATHFERRGRRLGHAVVDLYYRRTETAASVG